MHYGHVTFTHSKHMVLSVTLARLERQKFYKTKGQLHAPKQRNLNIERG